MIDLDISLTDDELNKLIAPLNMTREAANAAAKRATRKMAKWTELTALRTMSSQMRIEQKLLRKRFRIYAEKNGLEQKLWIGLNAFAAKRLGKPTKSGSGIKVGTHFFDNAFVIKKYGGGVYQRSSADRYPLELSKIEIDAEAAAAIRSALRGAETRMLELMRQELNFEFSKIISSAKI